MKNLTKILRSFENRDRRSSWKFFTRDVSVDREELIKVWKFD